MPLKGSGSSALRMSCLLGVPCRGHHRPHIGEASQDACTRCDPAEGDAALCGEQREAAGQSPTGSVTLNSRGIAVLLMLAEKAPSRLVRVGQHRDGDTSLLVFWGAAVIERAHPDLLYPGEFHALRFEEPPDGFDPALDETVVVVARARGVAEAPEPHD